MITNVNIDSRLLKEELTYRYKGGYGNQYDMVVGLAFLLLTLIGKS